MPQGGLLSGNAPLELPRWRERVLRDVTWSGTVPEMIRALDPFDPPGEVGRCQIRILPAPARAVAAGPITPRNPGVTVPLPS